MPEAPDVQESIETSIRPIEQTTDTTTLEVTFDASDHPIPGGIDTTATIYWWPRMPIAYTEDPDEETIMHDDYEWSAEEDYRLPKEVDVETGGEDMIHTWEVEVPRTAGFVQVISGNPDEVLEDMVSPERRGLIDNLHLDDVPNVLAEQQRSEKQVEQLDELESKTDELEEKVNKEIEENEELNAELEAKKTELEQAKDEKHDLKNDLQKERNRRRELEEQSSVQLLVRAFRQLL